MRISDWSSDVCSSDLPGLGSLSLSDRATLANMAPEYGATMGFFPIDGETVRYLGQTARGGAHLALVETYARVQGLWHDPNGRSEEHTSELQSLMRTSYAVFCLKKKKKLKMY